MNMPTSFIFTMMILGSLLAIGIGALIYDRHLKSTNE